MLLAVVGGHLVEAELVDAFAGQREADQAATVRRHEIDCGGCRHLRRDDEVALVLAILVVDKDVHAPVARFLDDFLDGAEHRAVVVRRKEPFELAERFGGRVPVRLGAVAQGVCVEPGGACQPGLAHAALVDESTDLVDKKFAHAARITH